MLLACECDARGRLGLEEQAYPQRPRLLAALAAAQSVATEDVAARAAAAGLQGARVREMIYQARVDALGAQPAP